MPPEQTHPADAGGVPAQVVDVVDVDDRPAGALELEGGVALELDTPVVIVGAVGVVTAAGVVAVGGMTHKPPSHTNSSLG